MPDADGNIKGISVPALPGTGWRTKHEVEVATAEDTDGGHPYFYCRTCGACGPRHAGPDGLELARREADWHKNNADEGR